MSLKFAIKAHPYAAVALAIGVYFAALILSGAIPGGWAATVPAYLAFCLLTGVFEEGVFCGVIYPCLTVKDSPLRSAIFAAMLFGLAHLTFANGLALCLLKVVQAALFSFCMVGLYAWTQHLVIPMMVHAAFDAVYFWDAYVRTGVVPPYAQAVAPDANIALLAGTALLFAVVALIIWKFVLRKKP